MNKEVFKKGDANGKSGLWVAQVLVCSIKKTFIKYKNESLKEGGFRSKNGRGGIKDAANIKKFSPHRPYHHDVGV